MQQGNGAHPTSPPLGYQDASKLYEDGKHRRYELLFAVNGGAFAIAKLIGDKPGIGQLRIPYLALGMVLFTITMVFDIYTFGKKWHVIGNQIEPAEAYVIFGSPGRIVLVVIGILLCLAWICASGLI